MKVISLICIETRREKARSLVRGPEATVEDWAEREKQDANHFKGEKMERSLTRE